MKKYILASGSPRRKELIKKLGLNIEIIPSKYEEELDNHIFSYKKIENLAYNKALYVAKEIHEPAIVIGADTVVVYKNSILTKPIDKDDAFNTLKLLSNNTHDVVTAIAIIDKYHNKTKIQSITTNVTFDILTDQMISDYIEKFKPFDKAGSYGIQELPNGFVKHINGSEENVIGLCTKALSNILNEL